MATKIKRALQEPGSLDEDDAVIQVEQGRDLDAQLDCSWDKAAKRPKRGTHVMPAAQLPTNEEELARYSNAKDIVWCQDEPRNQGAWYQILHHLRAPLDRQQDVIYAGREASASPAVLTTSSWSLSANGAWPASSSSTSQVLAWLPWPRW